MESKIICKEVLGFLKEEKLDISLVLNVENKYKSLPDLRISSSISVIGVVVNKNLVYNPISKLLCALDITDGIEDITITLPMEEYYKFSEGDLIVADIVRHLDPIESKGKQKPSVDEKGQAVKKLRVPLTTTAQFGNTSLTDNESTLVFVEGVYQVKQVAEQLKIKKIKNIL